MFENVVSRFNSLNPFNYDIYYAASIWGVAGDPEFNLKIIERLKQHGNVLSEQLFLPDYRKKEHLDLRRIHDRDIRWIRKSRVVVGEITNPSLGVGYEFREATFGWKKVLGLYHPQEGKNLSAMIAGSPNVVVKNYHSTEEAVQIVDDFFARL